MDPGIIHALAILETEPDNADALAQLNALAQGGGNGHGHGRAQAGGDAAADLPVRRALTEARRVHRERGDFELVARLIDLELGWETDKGRRADLYYEKGRVLADELLQEPEAVRAFERVLELRPDDEGTNETLSHIALVRDNWQKIAKKYLDEAQGSTDRQLTTSLYLSVAEIYAKYQPDDSVEKFLKKALEVEPRNVKASARLERLYRAESRWDTLVTLLEQRIEAAGTKEDRVGGYLAVAEVQARKLGKRAEASEAYKKALGIDPANPRALRALIDFYTVEENWQALIRVYENALRARPRGEPELGMLLQIGMLWWKKLGNLESADEYWKRVRKAEPAHPAMLDFYRQLYGKEPVKLLPVLQQAQKVEADAKKRFDLAVEMAQLAEGSAGTVEKAIELWKGVVKLDPTQPTAVDALRRLYEKTEKWNALLELLKERIEALPKDGPGAVNERVQRLLEVVAIYRDKLNLDVMVINTYNNILQLKPDHHAALVALAQKYEQMGRWNDLIGVLQRTVDGSSDTEEKTRLLRRIAALWIEKFGNFNQAVKPLEELYALAPTDAETVARLRDIYGRRRSWRALIDLERKELEQLGGAERRAKLIEMAKLAAEKLGDAREAISIWNRLLELDEGDADALAALAALYEREKRWPGVIEILRRQKDAISDVKAQVVLLEKIGTIYTERLGAPEQAIATYQEIVRRAPSHAKAMRTLRELYAQGGRYDELEKLYGAQGQWEELCEVLLAVAERVAELDRKLQLYQRVAEIAQNELKAPERAAKAYERILALTDESPGPVRSAAAQALLPIYRAGEKWPRLLATYEIVLGQVAEGPGGDDERLALHREIRALCEEKLGSKGLAFSWCAKAYALRPNDAQLESELERLAEEAEAWDELVEIYVEQVASEKDDERQVRRYRQLGRIALNRLHRPADARAHFEAVLARRPDDEEALATLEQVFVAGESYPELLAIYRRREGSADPQRRLELLFKMAWIEEEQVSDAAAAIATYQKILNIDPAPATQLRALRALEKLYAARSDGAGLAGTLEKQLALAAADDLDTRVALLVQLGELYESKLAKRGEALTRFRAAFELQPAHRGVQTALERWLAPSGDVPTQDRVDVARLMVPLYEQRDESARLAEALEILLHAAAEPEAQLRLLRRLAALVGASDTKRAYDYTTRIFKLQPADGENRHVMSELADQLECPDDLAVRLGDAEKEAATRGDVKLACELAWDLGELCDVRLGMPDEAEAAYRRVIERDPENAGAHAALTQLYSANERWKELRALLERKKERAATPAERLQLLFSISDLDEGVLGDEAAAVRDYAEVLEIEPASLPAFRALDRLYTTAEKWRELDELLARRVPHAPTGPESTGTPDARAHIKFRRGELYMTRLNAPDRAVELLEESLADEPRHEGARKGLEALMKRPELRQRIARALEPYYLADEAWSKLALVLGAQREAPGINSVDAAALTQRLAELQEERLGARQLALTTWREALRLQPSDERNRQNVERLAIMLGRHAELATAWEEAFAAADPADLSVRGELLEKAAQLYEGELRDVEKARGAYQRLLELDPTNLATARPAATALARLYQANESWPQLIEVLHRQADWAEQPDERKELLFRVGRIQEDLTVDPSAAIRTYREILEADPQERRALDALEHLYQTQGAWAELVDVLRRRLDLEREPRARRDLSWRIAGLHERELGDSAEAIAGYHAILDEQPDDLPTLEALSRLFESQSRTADLLELLERRLSVVERTGRASDVQLSIGLRMRLADLLSSFERHDQALERYREVLERDPRHAGARAGLEKLLDDEDLRLRAAEVLEPYYQRTGETERLIRLAELWAKFAPDPRERITRLRRIAELKHQDDDLEGAFDAVARAARFAVGEPDLPGLLDALEELSPPEGRAPLVALYRELGPDVLDAAVQERIYLTIAADSHKLGDRTTARDYYRRVLDGASDHPRALDALESLYLEGREWDPLFEIYVQRAELATGDDERRRHYLERLAQLCEKELERPSEAIRAHESILELFPADAAASGALERLYLAAHRHADLAELLEKRLGFADDLDEAVALRYRLASLFDHELSDTDRAVENYRAALGGDPTHAGAIEALEKYLDDDAQRASAAEVLEPVYAARHDWNRLVRIYQIRLEAADDSRMRLLLTRRIARLYEEQLEDLEAAFTWFGKVFREEPTDRAIRDQLGRLAGILGAWDKLAAIYEDYLADVVGEEPPVAIEVLRTLAAIYQEKINDVDGAKRCYERLLAIDAADSTGFGNLEKLLVRAGRWQDLLDAYRGAATADAGLDPERQKALLFKQAEVLEERLRETDAAVDTYRAVLDLDGDDPRATTALDRLYTAGKRWHDLVELLLRRLEQADGAGWTELKLRLGGIYENELGDRPAAIDTYEEVLGRAHEQAEAVRALERLIVDHDHTFRIAQILEPIYRAKDAWQKLVVIYDAELEFIDERPKRIELLTQIAHLLEQRGNDGRRAFTALSRAWTEESAEPDGAERETALYGELARLARTLGAFGELVEVLEAAVQKSYDAELQARVYGRVAELKERELNDAAGAIESWRKVVTAREDDLDAWKALERLLEKERRTEELVAVLEKRDGLTTDVAEQKALAYRAAALYETQLQRPDSAIGTWRHVLTLDEDDRAALDALERLYAQKKAFRDLATIYARQIELATDETRRRALRFALAQTSERELGDATGAIDALRGVLAADPDDAEALETVARLYQGEGLWADHLEAIDSLTELQSVPAQRIELAFRAAEVMEKQISDVEAAIERYRRVLEQSQAQGTPHAGARASLERLVREAGTRELAADVLEPYYRDAGEFGPLIEVTELRLAAESDPTARRALLARIAELHEAGMEDLQAAFAAWGRVLAEDAGDLPAQQELERLSEIGGQPGELARLYEERLAASFDPEVQRALALKLGALYETKLGSDEQAIGAYNKALELPAEPGAETRAPLLALDRLLVRAARWRELAEVLQQEAESAETPDEQAELYFRLGTLRAGELVDLDGALLAFKEALERLPEHPGARAGLERLLASTAHAEAALDLLEPLYDADGNHQKWVQLAEVRLSLLDESAEKVALLERIAERAAEALDDRPAALDAWARALALRPDEARLAEEVERAAQAGRLDARAGEIFESTLTGSLAPEAARELGLRAARLWERLGELGRAEARYLAVRAAEADNADALAALERIYRVRGATGQLAEVLERRAGLEFDVTQKKTLFAEAARLHETALSAPARAIDVWREVLEADEADAAALAALARLLEAQGRWNELVDHLAHTSRFVEAADQQVALKSRIAAILAEQVGDLDRAVEAYRDLIDLAPDALAALEALEELERRRGDFTAVQEVLVRRLQAVGAGAAQVPVYRKLAALAVDKQSSPEDAIGYLHEILALAPDDAAANEQLAQLLEKTEKWHDLIEVLSQQATLRGGRGDAAGEIALLVRAADVWEQKLSSPESATDILERILERDPSNVRALGALARIYESAHDLERSRATLEKAVALATTGQEKAELQFRIGRLEAEANGDEAGEPFYVRALAAQPSHGPASEALEKLARARGDWARVAALLAEREKTAADPARRALCLELASVYVDKLQRAGDALPYLERAAKLSPDDPAVLEPLADLYFGAGRLDDALPMYRALAERIGKGKRTKDLGRLYHRIGAIAEKRGDVALALEQYNAAYQVDPAHAPTLAALGRLYMVQNEWEKARKIYRGMLLQNLDPASGISKAEVYLHLGEIHERLGEAPKAAGMFERGLEVDAAHAGLREALARVKK